MASLPPLRSALLRLLVRGGIVPADLLLLYDANAFRWNSGFGPYAEFCYGLVRALQPRAVVEIGAAYGRSTCYIAAALDRNRQGCLYSIDPHEPTSWNDGDPTVDTFAILTERLRELRLTHRVQHVRKSSKEAVANWTYGQVDLLLIDGSHSEDDVRSDFEGFLPHLVQDGLVMFHDTMWEYHKDNPWYRSDQGVPRAVQGIIGAGFPAVTLKPSWGLTLLQNSRGAFQLWPHDPPAPAQTQGDKTNERP